MTTKYLALSPDGFSVNHSGGYYRSKKLAKEAIKEFVENYKQQGYYSTVRNGERLRIPVDELSDYCEIQCLQN